MNSTTTHVFPPVYYLSTPEELAITIIWSIATVFAVYTIERGVIISNNSRKD